MKERIAGMLDSEKASGDYGEHIPCALRADPAHGCRQARRERTLSAFPTQGRTQLGLIKKIINRVTARDEKLDPGLAQSMISKAKNNGWAAPRDEETVIGAVYARYDRELRALNAMDFDDLLDSGGQPAHRAPGGPRKMALQIPPHAGG